MTATGRKVEVCLCARGAAAATEFYKKAFGAVETGSRIFDPHNRTGHAEFRTGETLLMISDEYPEINILSSQSPGSAPSPTNSTAHARARSPIPIYRWSTTRQIEDLTPQEIEARAKTPYK